MLCSVLLLCDKHWMIVSGIVTAKDTATA